MISDAISAGRTAHAHDFVVAYYLTCELVFATHFMRLQGEPQTERDA